MCIIPSSVSQGLLDEGLHSGKDDDRVRIVVLPGDGTGREVMREALKVLDVIQNYGPVEFEIRRFLWRPTLPRNG